jgi:cytochrome c biogenesis protein CcdA
MTDLWLVLIPILLTDVANPVLFALLVYLAGRPRGLALSTAALGGHTAAYFSSGVVIALAFDQLTEFMATPGPVSYGLGGLLGLLLLWVAWLSRGDRTAAEPEEDAPVSSGAAFVTGAVVNFVSIPFALPYFAAIDQILKAELDVGGSLAMLGAYNLAYLAPFLAVPILTAVMGERAQIVLGRINARVERIAGVLMPLVLGAVGIALTLDAGLYFVRGEGLF